MLSKSALSSFDYLDDNYVILVLTSSGKLEEKNSSIVRKMMKNKMCLYVAINQPYERMMSFMKKKEIDTNKIFFIDCITETSGGKAERAGNCLYINSPSNLTELSIAITQALQAMPDNKFLFMDALSTLVIYNTPNSFARFAHFLMTRVKLMELNGIFMVVEKEIKEEVLSNIMQFSDKVIRLN